MKLIKILIQMKINRKNIQSRINNNKKFIIFNIYFLIYIFYYYKLF